MPVSEPQAAIRTETENDFRAIHDLTKRAFQGKRYSDGTEQDLINNLRADGALTLSFVAEQDRIIVGHVALSPAFASDGSTGWYALGPIAVEPARQRQGIGGKLINEAMFCLTAMTAKGCIVIGDTNYYSRHGFVPRPDLAPKGEPAEHYMVRHLVDGTPDCVVSFHPILQTSGTP